MLIKKHLFQQGIAIQVGQPAGKNPSLLKQMFCQCPNNLSVTIAKVNLIHVLYQKTKQSTIKIILYISIVTTNKYHYSNYGILCAYQNTYRLG